MTDFPRQPERRVANQGAGPLGVERRALGDRRTENNRQFVSFRVGRDVLLLDIQEVQEVQLAPALTAVPLASPLVAGLINLRGQIVPAIDLGLAIGAKRQSEGPAMSVVVRTDEGAFSLLVDEVHDVVEASPTMRLPPPPHLEAGLRGLVSGVYKTPETLSLILDLAGVLKRLAPIAP